MVSLKHYNTQSRISPEILQRCSSNLASGLYITLRNLSWDTVFVDNDIDASIACWYDMFLSCVDEFVPKVVIKDANRPPWIDKEVLLLLRKKNRTRRKAKLKNSVHLWERFRELRRQVKKIVKFKKRSHLSKLSCSLGDNPRKFWSYYKTITKTTRIPRVIKHESVQATRPFDQANLFSMFFHSVFAPPDSSSAAIYLPRLKVTMHLQGCLACKRCSASGLNCRYLNPYIKLKLIGLAIRLYRKFWKKMNCPIFHDS